MTAFLKALGYKTGSGLNSTINTRFGSTRYEHPDVPGHSILAFTDKRTGQKKFMSTPASDHPKHTDTQVFDRDFDAVRHGAGHHMEKVPLEKAFKTESWTHDDDMTGKKCTGTKGCKGTYKETSQQDDADGVVHCVKCGHGVKRWKEEPDDVKEGYVKKRRRKPLHRRTLVRKKAPRLQPAKKTVLRMGDDLRSFKDFMNEGLFGDIVSGQLGNKPLHDDARNAHKKRVAEWQRDGWTHLTTHDEGKRLRSTMMKPRYRYSRGVKKPDWADFVDVTTHVSSSGKIKHVESGV